MNSEIQKIFKIFEGKGELYLVGGYVRDLLMNLPMSSDYDFATNLIPEDTENLLSAAGFKTFSIGKAFGTISFYLDENRIEITTYRCNESYTKNNRHPVVEWGASIEDDLARRDFTCNAIAMNSYGETVDPFCGTDAIKNKTLDTPIDPMQSFEDDSLRLLRSVRFCTRFGFLYSERVKYAMHKCAKRLLILSRERILDEMNKILMLDNVDVALNDLCEYRLINYFIPELISLRNIKQNSEFHHKDALAHTIQVAQNTPKDLMLRWAGLLHDISKPATYTEDFGEIHFYEHDELGSRVAQSIMYRMGFSKQMIKDVTYLVKNHMRANLYDKTWSDAAIRRFIKETGEYCDKLLTLSKADITSHNPRTVSFHLSALEEFSKRIEEQRNFKESPKCPISGLAIMEYFDLPPCKKVGEIKDLILNNIISGDLKMDDSEEAMLEYAKNKLEIE